MSEEIYVYKQGIQIKNIGSLTPARFHRECLVVIGIEVIGETTKKHGHGNIRFAVTEIAGRIKNGGSSAGARHVIACP